MRSSWDIWRRWAQKMGKFHSIVGKKVDTSILNGGKCGGKVAILAPKKSPKARDCAPKPQKSDDFGPRFEPKSDDFGPLTDNFGPTSTDFGSGSLWIWGRLSSPLLPYLAPQIAPSSPRKLHQLPFSAPSENGIYTPVRPVLLKTIRNRS